MLGISSLSLHAMNDQEQQYIEHTKNAHVVEAILHQCQTMDQTQEKLRELERRGIINHQVGKDQATALHYTIVRRNFLFAQALILAPETDVNLITAQGVSPFRACLNEISALASKCDYFKKIKDSKFIAEFSPIIEQYKSLLTLLIKAGADYQADIQPLSWSLLHKTAQLKAIEALAECGK